MWDTGPTRFYPCGSTPQRGVRASDWGCRGHDQYHWHADEASGGVGGRWSIFGTMWANHPVEPQSRLGQMVASSYSTMTILHISTMTILHIHIVQSSPHKCNLLSWKALCEWLSWPDWWPVFSNNAENMTKQLVSFKPTYMSFSSHNTLALLSSIYTGPLIGLIVFQSCVRASRRLVLIDMKAFSVCNATFMRDKERERAWFTELFAHALGWSLIAVVILWW